MCMGSRAPCVQVCTRKHAVAPSDGAPVCVQECKMHSRCTMHTPAAIFRREGITNRGDYLEASMLGRVGWGLGLALLPVLGPKDRKILGSETTVTHPWVLSCNLQENNAEESGLGLGAYSLRQVPRPAHHSPRDRSPWSLSGGYRGVPPLDSPRIGFIGPRTTVG